MVAVRAKYQDGVFTPVEPLDLEEGREVTLSGEEDAEVAPSPDGAAAVPPEDGAPQEHGLPAIIKRVLERQKDIPPEEWKDIPRDLAMNHKHYLYGHPKEED